MRPDASENSQISPSTIVQAARAAGSHPHLPSVLLQGRKDANIPDSSGESRMRAPQVTPSPALPRKREREQTEFAAQTGPITSPTGQVSRIIRPLARVRRRARAQPLHHDRNERENTERHECAEKLRRERRLHVELEPA